MVILECPGESDEQRVAVAGGDALLYINSDLDPNTLYRLDPVTGAVLSVETTDGLVYDGLGFESASSAPTNIYEASMDSDPGWTLEGNWQYGAPTGGGSGSPPEPLR